MSAPLSTGLVQMTRPAGQRVGRRNPAFDPLLPIAHELVKQVLAYEATGQADRTQIAFTVDINAAMEQLKDTTTPAVAIQLANGAKRVDEFVMGRLRSFLAKRIQQHSFTVALSQENPNLLGVWYNGDKTAEQAAADAAAAEGDDGDDGEGTAEAPAVPSPGKGRKAAAAAAE